MKDPLKWYGFKDEMGHDLHKCGDYIDLLNAVRMKGWRPVGEAPKDTEVWVWDANKPDVVEKGEYYNGGWFTADINCIPLTPTYFHDLKPDPPDLKVDDATGDDVCQDYGGTGVAR